MASYKSIAQRKKAEQELLIPKKWRLSADILAQHAKDPRRNSLGLATSSGVLTDREVQITESYDAVSLSQEIRALNLSIEEVTMAFCKRAAIAHQLTNCLTEIFFDRALERAKALDRYLASGKAPTSPLFGVPVSLKDTFCVEGFDASVGLAAFCHKPSTQNSTLVDLLLAAGAILYCKTNVPQTLAQLDSHNNIFGRTISPINASLTAGGSSGGEGALVALRGSILGVGTDVGGSIRIPAFVNGLYGIKPSCGRVPYQRQAASQLAGFRKLGLEACAGPIATSLRSCVFFLEVVASLQPWTFDTEVFPDNYFDQAKNVYSLFKTYSSTQPSTVLSIGVVKTDGLIEPLPPIQRLLSDVSEAFAASSVRFVDIDISHLFRQCQSLANALLGTDGSQHMSSLLSSYSEPLSPWLSSRFKTRAPMTLEQVRALHAKREELEALFLKIWKQVDVLICPVAPHPVPEIDRWNGVSYTIAWNLLDYPAGVIPIRQFTADDTKGEVPSTEPLSSWDKRNRELWTDVDRSVYIGSPLSIQVVVPKLHEMRLCEAMDFIESTVQLSSQRTWRSKL